MEDETRYATVTLSPAAIMWADGDIWVQKIDPANKSPIKSDADSSTKSSAKSKISAISIYFKHFKTEVFDS